MSPASCPLVAKWGGVDAIKKKKSDGGKRRKDKKKVDAK